MVAQLIEPPELALEIGVPEATLSNWRWRGSGPKYVKVGRHVRYRREDVDAWIESQVRGGDTA